MAAPNQLLHTWDDTPTGRTRHLFELPSGKPVCAKPVIRCTIRRHVKRPLYCVQCQVVATELNSALD